MKTIANITTNYPFELFASQGKAGQSHSSTSTVPLHSKRSLNAAGTHLSVNATHGNALLHDKAFTIADDGVELSVGMIWNSVQNTWQFSAKTSAKVNESSVGWYWPKFNANQDSSIDITESDGRVVKYVKKGDQYICSEPDQHGLSTMTIDLVTGQCVRFFPDTGIKENYDKQGKLLAQTLATGQKIEYRYNDKGEVVAIDLPSGRQINLQADPRNASKLNLELVGLNGAIVPVCSYLLDRKTPGSLVSMIPQPDGSFYQTKYSSEMAKDKHVLTVTSDDQTFHQLALGLNGEIKSLQEGNLNEKNRRLWKFDRQEKQNKMVISAEGQPMMEVCVDQAGHIESLKMAGDDRVRQFKCDQGGRAEKVTDKDGNISEITYDDITGLVKQIKNSNNGLVTEHSYQSDLNSPQFGLRLTTSVRDGERIATTQFIYNDRRQCLFEVSPEGRVKYFKYDDHSPYRLQEMHQLAANYNNNNSTAKLNEISGWMAALSAETANLKLVTKYAYDRCGRRESTQVLSGELVLKATNLELDALGRTTKLSTLSSTKQQSYDGLDRIRFSSEGEIDSPLFMQVEHQYHGNQAISIKSNGLTETTQTDACGQVCGTIQQGLDKKSVRSSFKQRNEDGSLSKVTRSDGSTLRYFYDKPGRIKYSVCSRKGVTEHLYDACDRLIGHRSYDLNTNSSVETLKQIDGLVAKCERFLTKLNIKDNDGHIRFEVTMKKVLTKNGLEEFQGSITEHSYCLGQRIATIARAGVVGKESFGNLDCETLSGLSASLSNPNDRVTRCVYDLDGNMIRKWVMVSIDEKTGASLGYYELYHYDALGLCIGKDVVTDKMEFSEKKDIEVKVNSKLSTRHWYDLAGRKIATLDPDNYLTTYTYDDKGQLKCQRQYADPQPSIDRASVKIDLPKEGKTDKYSTFEYDDLGRVSSVSEPNLGLITRKEYKNHDLLVIESKTDTLTGKTRKTHKLFNEFGELISEASERVSAAMTAETGDRFWNKKIYHPVTGLLLKEIDELGNQTLYYYGANRKPVLAVNALGAVIKSEYDLLTAQATKVYAYCRKLDQTVLKKLQDDATRTGFCEEATLFAMLPQTHLKDRVTYSRYNSDGSINYLKKDNGGQVFSFYNSFNEVEKTKTEVEKDKFLEAIIQHDLRGNISQTLTDPNGLAIKVAAKYEDALNRLTESTDANDHKVAIGYEGLREQTLKDLNDPTRLKVVKQDGFMRASSESDWNGANTTKHVYDDAIRKHTVISPVSEDRNTSEVSNAFGEVVETIVAGNSTIFAREVDGQIGAISHPDGSSESTDYDLRGLKEKTKSLLGLESSYTQDATGHLGEQVDDIAGRKLSTVHVSDAFGELDSVVDATGLDVHHYKDKACSTESELTDIGGLFLTKQRVTNFIGHLMELSKGDKKNVRRYREMFERDLVGNELVKKIDLGDDKFAVLMTSQFDKSGHAIKVTDGNGNSTYHTYDKRGNLSYTLNSLGYVTKHIYDKNNFCIQKIRYAQAVTPVEIDQIDRVVVSEHDENTHYIRDAEGLIRFEITGSAVIEYRYNGAKKQTDKICYAQEIDLNQTKISDIPALLMDSVFVNNPLNRCAHTDYDVMGRPLLERDPEGGETAYRYDKAGNEVVRIQNGERTSYSVYDKFGNLRFQLDANGYLNELRYNDVHVCTDKITYSRNLHDVIGVDEMLELIQLLGQSGLERDTDSILKQMSAIATKVQLEEHDVHLVNILDKAHRLSGLQDGEENSENYELDGLGEVLERKDKRKNLWINQYNSAHKLERSISPEVNLSVVSQDPATNQLQIKPLNATSVESAFEYDAAYNQTTTTLADNIPEDKRAVKAVFDARSHVSGTELKDATIAEGQTIAKKDLSTKIVRDFAGRAVITTLENSGREFTVFDRNGRKRFEVDAEGYVVEYQYTHAFSQYTKVIHYAEALAPSLLKDRKVGLTLAEMQSFTAAFKSKKLDRTLTYAYNRNGKKVRVTKDKCYTGYAVASKKDHDHDGDGVVAVKEFASETVFEYNQFSELVAERLTRMKGRPDSLTQRFYDHNGNEIATVSPEGYVTLRTFGVKNLKSEGGKYLELSSIQYFNPVPADSRQSLTEILAAIVADPKNDRKLTRKFDRRHLCIETKLSDGHPFFKTYRAEDRMLASIKDNSEVKSSTRYDENEQPIEYTDAEGEKSYLVRDALGNIIWEIGYPVELVEGVRTIPVFQRFYNAHQQVIGEHVYTLSGDLKFDENGRIDLENLIKPSPLDKISLTLMCNRGLPLIHQDNYNGLSLSAYNEMKKKVRSQRAVSVFDKDNLNKPARVSVQREKEWKFNLRSDVVMNAVTDEFGHHESHYLVNAFRERTDEGPALGEYCIHSRFDNAGNKWLTNEDRGIATLSFADEAGAEVVTYRSAIKDFMTFLSDNGYDLAKSEIADADYERVFKLFQRFVTYRNQDGQAVRQDTPWYAHRPGFEPENYPVAFTVIKDPAPGSTNYMLRFNPPDEVFLKMVFKLRLKGATEWDEIKIDLINDPVTNRQYCVIPLGNRSSDAYEYKLDFFHQYKVNDELVIDRLPSYRADGEVMLDTGHYENSTSPIWYTESSKTLVIAGNAKNIYGIELLKDGKPFKRIAGTRAADGKLRIDLAQENCTEYSFKYVYGSAVLAQGLKLGQPGENAVNVFRPTFRFDSATSISVINNSLPPELASHLRYVNTAATKQVPEPSHFPGQFYDLQGYKIFWSKPIATSFLNITDAGGTARYSHQITANAPWRFWVAYESKEEYYDYLKSYTQLPVNTTPPLLSVKAKSSDDSHALVVSLGAGHECSYQLVNIANSQLLALTEKDFAGLPANAEMNLVSLSACKTSEIVASLVLGGSGNQLFQSEEISISGFKIDKSLVGGFDHERPTDTCTDIYFGYEWACSVTDNYYLHVKHVGTYTAVIDIKSLPRSGCGNRLYFQEITPHGFQNWHGYDPGSVTLDVVRDGFIIPIAQDVDQHVLNTSYPSEKIDFYEWGSRGIWATMRANIINQYKYDDVYALHFKHLPEGADNAVFEYCYTTSLGKKEWRTATCKMGSYAGKPSGLSVFTNNIMPGNYPCRILARKGNEVIKVSDPRFKQDANGYCYLDVSITKRQTQYGQVFSSRHRDLQLHMVKPFRLLDPDRWDNLRAVIDRMANKIKSDFNLYNKNIKTKSPAVHTTDAAGVTDRAPQKLTTRHRVNKRNHPVEEVDAGGDSMKFLPNLRGHNLCVEDADGVQSEHEYDLLDHCVASKAAAFGMIRSSFRRVEGLLIETRTYPNLSSEEITYNEDGHVIRRADRMARKGNPDDATHIHPDDRNNHRVTIHPISQKEGETQHKAEQQDLDHRNGVLLKKLDGENHAQTWDYEGATAADKYVGNITRHTDLSGQVIQFSLDYNKQIFREKGMIGDIVKRNIETLFDEAGRETDIIDDGAGLTTRKRHNKEDYCKEYYFIGHDGRVYQATNTKYDELHRIHQICDTHILIEFGYDKKSNRRYALASVLGEDRKEEFLCRESWYDYSPAGRVRFRDCVLEACQIKHNKDQGMELTYKHKDGRVESQKSLTKEGKAQTATPIYGVGNAISGVATRIDGVLQKAENRKTDAADRMYERTVLTKEKDNVKEVLETFKLDLDGSVISQTSQTTNIDNDGDRHLISTVTRTVRQKSDTSMVEDVITVLSDVARDVVKDIDVIIHDEVTTLYRAGDSFTPASVETSRKSVAKGGEGHDKDNRIDVNAHADKVNKARVVTRVNANDAITGIGPDAPTNEVAFPDGYRSFVVNSENCYLLKETNKGRNYFFYAQKRPGKTTLYAYFGDLPDEVSRFRSEYHPKEFNMDINHQPFSSNYPPPYPGKAIADGVRTYRQIAEYLNYTGYAEAIAWANNADADSIPTAGTEILIPTLVSEVPETAHNGSMPAIEMLLGSMYPALAMPQISIKPPKVNWALIAAEVAVGAVATYFTAGALGEIVLNYIGSEIAAAAVTYAIAGAAGSVASQGVAIAAGQQEHFNAKAIATQALASAVSGGILKGVGGGDAATNAAKSFSFGDLAKNVATAEAIAVAQQGLLMANGLQSKPDWKGFATAAFNGAAGTVINSGFADGAIRDGVYTGVTMAADTLLRGQHVDASVLSANVVGSMLGSAAGREASKHVQSQQTEQAYEKAAATQPAPSSQPSKQARVSPHKVSSQAKSAKTAGNHPRAESSASNDWVADEYERTHAFGAGRNWAALWNNRQLSASAPPESNNSPAEHHEMSTMEKTAIVGLGVVAGVLLLPEAIVMALGSAAAATIIGPVAEVLAVDSMMGAGAGFVLRGGVGALSTLKGAAFFAASAERAASVVAELPGQLMREEGVFSGLNLRLRIERNLAESRAAREASNFPIHTAKEDQLLSGYNVDQWKMITLNKGDVVYGGLPGQSSYYTSFEVLIESGGNSEALGLSLQVKPHVKFGYRPNIGEYEVNKTIRVPTGTVEANSELGSGNGTQYFIAKELNYLTLKNDISLEEFYELNMPRNKFSH